MMATGATGAHDEESISGWIQPEEALKHQGGRCTHCRLYFTMEDKIEIHHADGKHNNRQFLNLRLLHRICHDRVHGKGTSCPT